MKLTRTVHHLQCQSFQIYILIEGYGHVVVDGSRGLRFPHSHCTIDSVNSSLPNHWQLAFRFQDPQLITFFTTDLVVSDRLGFVKDNNRVNVVVARARDGLLIENFSIVDRGMQEPDVGTS